MMNTTCRWLAPIAAVFISGWLAGCADSGHSLGTSQGSGGARSPGTGGISGAGGTPSVGGAAGTKGSGGNASATGGATLSTGAAGGTTGVGGQGGASAGGTSGTGGQGGVSVRSDGGTSSGDAVTTPCAYRGESCGSSRACCGPLVCLSFGGPSTCYESMPPPPDASVSSDAPDGGADTSTGCNLAGGCPDAEAETPCPSAPPTQGNACAGQAVCSYEDCPGSGHTQASCRSGQWALSTGACGTVDCQGANTLDACASGEVCLVRAGGALLVSCIDNPCAPGLVSADCSGVTDGCTPLFSTTSGLTYYCHTCPTGTCP